MSRKNNKKRVVCAMSGGVDSAVSAALLTRAGFDVVGVFMKFWNEPVVIGSGLSGNRCCSDESELRARKTALQLGILFYMLDVRGEFKKMVADRFIADTKAGLTPNPCVVCNREIKFGLLIDKARQMGADLIATGHYAQIKKTKDGIYHLLKGADTNKDQSYFLWRLGQDQLKRVIFPVGCFEKSEVRELAKKWRLPSAAAPESQEVCFANGDMDGFLAKHCGQKSGEIVDMAGKVIGVHAGLWFYTIGQRKGIKLSGGPFYVVAKDFKKNRLIVANDAGYLGRARAKLTQAHWIDGVTPVLPLRVKARIRYRGKEMLATIENDRGLKLNFIKPQFAVTPGQSAVFYRGREVIGGGLLA